ncbi:AB hydrolase superfamily protein [Yarrowia sp. B02]|nr:AB hydrolase superfamily protein [Yarrowia sp. B02]
MAHLTKEYYEPYHHDVILGGKRWHYLDIPPEGKDNGRVLVLVHGFPDFWYGWRHQIPVFRKRGHRIILPTLLGFPGSEVPEPPSMEDFEENEEGINIYTELGQEDDCRELNCYGFKFFADCMAELLKKLNIKSATFLGHDWGAHYVPKVWAYHPEIVDALSSACWYYQVPEPEWVPLTEFSDKWPTTKYQLQFGGDAVNNIGPGMIPFFLRRSYTVGANFDGEPDPEAPMHMTEEEFAVYEDHFTKEKRSLAGPFTYYRSRKLNWEQDKENFLDKGATKKDLTVNVPYLYIGSTNDIALIPEMSMHLDEYVEKGKLTREHVPTSHWALFEAPDQVNKIYVDWLDKLDKTSKL